MYTRIHYQSCNLLFYISKQLPKSYYIALQCLTGSHLTRICPKVSALCHGDHPRVVTGAGGTNTQELNWLTKSVAETQNSHYRHTIDTRETTQLASYCLDTFYKSVHVNKLWKHCKLWFQYEILLCGYFQTSKTFTTDLCSYSCMRS